MDKRILLVLVIVMIILLALPVLAKPKNTPPGQQRLQQPTAATPDPSTPTATPITTPTTAVQEAGTDWEMIGAIVGIIAVIGALVGWYISKKRKSKTSDYLNNINVTYTQYKSDTSKCEANLYLLKGRIEKDFTSGKIDEQALDFLHRRIEKYLKNVRRGIVEDMDLSPEARKEMNEMLKDGKITEEEYDSFIQSKNISEKDRKKMKKHLSKWKHKDGVR